MKRTAREHDDFWKTFPLCMPTTQAAFVLLHHRGKKRADKRRDARSSGENDRRGNGVAFVRHGGRATAAHSGGLGKFADFGLCVQRDIAGDFSKSSGEQAERGSNFGDAVAVAVPGNIRELEMKLLRKGLRDIQSFFVERGESPDGAAELQHAGSSLHFGEAPAVTIQRVKPASSLETECRWEGVLHPGASGERRRAYIRREFRGG